MVSRSHTWNLKINIFLLIPVDIVVIQLYVELDGNAKCSSGFLHLRFCAGRAKQKTHAHTKNAKTCFHGETSK